jgi:hypothetical protein
VFFIIITFSPLFIPAVFNCLQEHLFPTTVRPTFITTSQKIEDNPFEGYNNLTITIILSALIPLLIMSAIVSFMIWRRRKKKLQYPLQTTVDDSDMYLYDALPHPRILGIASNSFKS